jgi:hypothetical protein
VVVVVVKFVVIIIIVVLVVKYCLWQHIPHYNIYIYLFPNQVYLMLQMPIIDVCKNIMIV